eukprot:scaffold78230_cov61-Attheya_sp.AAC.3
MQSKTNEQAPNIIIFRGKHALPVVIIPARRGRLLLYYQHLPTPDINITSIFVPGEEDEPAGPTNRSFTYVQKALFEDIEAAGGLQVAKNHHICESKSDIYGVHGTQTGAQDATIILKLECTSQTTKKKERKLIPFFCPPFLHHHQTGRPSSSNHKSAGPMSTPAKMSASKLPRGNRLFSSPAARIHKSNIMNYLEMSDDLEYDEIEVDIDSPEKNREVLIHRLTDLDGKNKQVLNGCEISMNQADLPDIVEKIIPANQVSPHQILIEMPSVSQGFRTKGMFHVTSEKVEQAHGITRTRVNDTSKETDPYNDGRKFILLNFPEDEVLDPLPFLIYVPDPEDQDQEGDIEMDYTIYHQTCNYN